MDYALIMIAAFGAAVLTFFSGFGLGTILTPVFALFFPIDEAIALTGVVHFANNLFKLTLVGMQADIQVLMRFGLAAVALAYVGAQLLLRLSDMPVLYRYELWGAIREISPIKLIISLLLIVFALIDLLPYLNKVQIGPRWLPLGGALSGFFGGLSGHQGALRSAFLVRAGLGKEAFIATGVTIGSFIDFTRISVYATRFKASDLTDNLGLVLAATGAAIAGAFIGNKMLKKVTIGFLQRFIAIGLIVISLALGAGLV
ncbi:MAG: TSUP family transporter [Bacteroidetes bacterium]|nr:TSUP family transporter [Bacteroidota bacterium]